MKLFEFTPTPAPLEWIQFLLKFLFTLFRSCIFCPKIHLNFDKYNSCQTEFNPLPRSGHHDSIFLANELKNGQFFIFNI